MKSAQRETQLQKQLSSTMVGLRDARLSLTSKLLEGFTQRVKREGTDVEAWARLNEDQDANRLYGAELMVKFGEIIRPETGFFSALFGPKRKPLTDEMIDKLRQAVSGCFAQPNPITALPDVQLGMKQSELRALLDALKQRPLDLVGLKDGYVKADGVFRYIRSLDTQDWKAFWQAATTLILALQAAEEKVCQASDLLMSGDVTVSRRAQVVTLHGSRYERQRVNTGDNWDDEIFPFWLWWYLLDADSNWGIEYDEDVHLADDSPATGDSYAVDDAAEPEEADVAALDDELETEAEFQRRTTYAGDAVYAGGEPADSGDVTVESGASGAGSAAVAAGVGVAAGVAVAEATDTSLGSFS